MVCAFCVVTLCLLFFFFSSRRRHTRCALVTGVQTCALPIFVIRTAVEDGRSADVAYPLRARLLVPVVITLAAFGAGIASGDAVDERLLVDGQLDHMVELHPLGGKERVKRLSLRNRTRATVQKDRQSVV